MERVHNRFTKIPNNVLEKLLGLPLSGSQLRLVFAVFRKTLGFQKKVERIGTAEVRRLTGLHSRTIMKELQKLRSWHIVKQIEPSSPGRSATWKLNVDLSEWQVVERLPGVSRLTDTRCEPNDSLPVSRLADSRCESNDSLPGSQMTPSSGSQSVTPKKKRNS